MVILEVGSNPTGSLLMREGVGFNPTGSLLMGEGVGSNRTGSPLTREGVGFNPTGSLLMREGVGLNPSDYWKYPTTSTTTCIVAAAVRFGLIFKVPVAEIGARALFARVTPRPKLRTLLEAVGGSTA